jgi:hypothetical protein
MVRGSYVESIRQTNPTLDNRDGCSYRLAARAAVLRSLALRSSLN